MTYKHDFDPSLPQPQFEIEVETAEAASRLLVWLGQRGRTYAYYWVYSGVALQGRLGTRSQRLIVYLC